MSETCTRCGDEVERVYTFQFKNDDDEIITHRLCWSCDHDIINGGDINDDIGEILMDRAENEYAYDPINIPKPKWLP